MIKTVKTSEYTINDLKAAWKSATTSDWLNHIKDELIMIDKELKESRPENLYYANYLYLVSKKLEVLAKSLGATDTKWSDNKTK